MLNKTLEKIILELIKSEIKDRDGLDSFKRKMAKKYKISCPKNSELLQTYHKMIENKTLRQSKLCLEKILCTRPVRSLSGIVNVSVLTKPYSCPGKCIYCPEEKGVPKSYLKEEPAVQRALLSKFSPYIQFQTRLKSLKQTGHPIDKIELRVIGGTWSYYTAKYQTCFIKECFRAANDFPNFKKDTTLKSSIEKEHKKNQKTKCRIIGISVETRPDYIDIKEIKRMRQLGVTRVELGVQSTFDAILKLNKRGHNVQAIIDATKILKHAGFKVAYQMMLNLPGSSFKKDVETFQDIFSNPDFKPDFLKIYPLALLKQSPLYRQYSKKKFELYSEKKLINLLMTIKKNVPYWCRIQRIIRDIPAKEIVQGGVKTSNLREIVQKEMRAKGLFCHCIRCREVRENKQKEKIYLFRDDYRASEGKEIFLSFENKKRNKLYALLRLRLNTHKVNTSIIREVHTYGQMAELKKSGSKHTIQHRGLGKKLIKEAEKISQRYGVKKIAVISGIGVRNYYRKLGYRLKDTYMVKTLKLLEKP